MITVISGTNRADSYTEKIADQYVKMLKNVTQEKVSYFKLTDLPTDFVQSQMYEAENQHAAITKLQNDHIIASDRLVVISPEYNGSYPGILKFFLDACSIRDYNESFKDKKVLLVGVSSGRAGNLRGMDHLSAVFNHLGSFVFPNKLPISMCTDIVDEVGDVQDKGALGSMEDQIDAFLKW